MFRRLPDGTLQVSIRPPLVYLDHCALQGGNKTPEATIRDANLQVHFFRDYEEPGNRRSVIREVDFIAERLDGRVVPIEVKFRNQVQEADLAGLRLFQHRFAGQCAPAVVVTRERSGWDAERQTLFIPLQDFLLAF